MVAAEKLMGQASAVAERPTSSGLRRFSLGDVSDMGGWLAGRLHERYPNLTEKNLIGWITGLTTANEYLFLRTDNAIMLAQMAHAPLDPTPIAQEIFVLMREGAAIDEARMLYSEMKTWAGRIGAIEIEVERFSDVPRDVIKSVMDSKMYARSRIVFLVPR